MKRFFLIAVLSILTVLLLIAAVAGVFFMTLDMNSYKDSLSKAAEKALGRPVIFAGPITHSLFPLGLSSSHIRIGDDAIYGDKPFLDIGKISFKASIPDLFQGRLEINEIILDKVNLKLAISATGKKNWENSIDEKALEREGVRSLQDAASTNAEEPDGKKKPVFTTHMGAVTVTSSTVTYRDLQNSKEYLLSLDAFTLDSLEQNTLVPLALKGVLEDAYEGTRADFTLTGDVICKTGGTVSINLAPLEAVVTNPKVTQETLPLSLAANLLYDAPMKSLAVNTLKGNVDGMTYEGSLALILPGGKNLEKGQALDLRGEVALGDIVIDSLQKKAEVFILASDLGKAPALGKMISPTITPGGKVLLTENTREAIAEASGKSATPSVGIKNTLAEVDVTAKSIKKDGFLFTATSGAIRLDKGKLSVPFTTATAGGTAKGTLHVDLTAANTPWGLDVDGSSLSAELLQQALGRKGSVSGTLHGQAKLTGKKPEKGNMLSSINGSASFSLANGKVLDSALLPSEVCEALRIPSDVAVNTAKASFSIKGGVLTTNDLMVESPLATARGKGSVNLPEESLSLTLDVLPGGLPPDVPLQIKGSFAAPLVTVNPEKLLLNTARGFLEAPPEVQQKIINQPKLLEKELRSIFKKNKNK